MSVYFLTDDRFYTLGDLREVYMAIKGFEFTGMFDVDGGGPGGLKTLFNNNMLSGQISKDVQTEEVTGSVDGKCSLEVLDTIVTSTSWTMTLATRAVDSNLIQLIMDEYWSADGAGTTKYVNTAKTSDAGIVTDARIAGTLTAANVQVSVVTSSSAATGGLSRPLTVITTGTPTAEQALVEAGQITVAPALAGQSIKYAIDEAQTAVQTIGVNTTGVTRLTNLSFFAELCMTGREQVYMSIPQMTKNAGVQMDLRGAGDISLEYKLITPSGLPSPVQFFRKAVA